MPPPPSPSSVSAIRFIPSVTTTAAGKSTRPQPPPARGLGILHLNCHVTPNASPVGEGITGVTATQVELRVAAQPREGEANKAVRELISQILHVPRSAVDVTRGHKSRDKTVTVTDFVANASSASADAGRGRASGKGAESRGKGPGEKDGAEEGVGDAERVEEQVKMLLSEEAAR